MKDSKFELACIVSSPFGENCFIAHLLGRNECLVVDPGMEPDRIISYMDRNKLVPAAILVTHGHIDHIAGNEHLKSHWPTAKLVIGKRESAKLTDAELNLSADFGLPVVSPPADVEVSDGEVFSAAGFELEVREISGHSVGHVVYLWKGHSPAMVFVGDVIFSGSIGRADFPDGNYDELVAGIRAKLFTLPDDTVLLPGHGVETSVGQERRTNPYVRD